MASSPQASLHPTSGALLAAWRQGDLGAFEALVDRFEGGLLRHGRSLLERGAEDAVQETLMRLAQDPPAPDPVGDGHAALQAWLHRVLRNLCTDQVRSMTARTDRERAVASREAVPGGQEDVQFADTAEAVRRELERLPADQREVLTLRLFNDHSYAEITRLTGIKEGTVGWLISVGLEALSRSLGSSLDPRGSQATTA